MKKRICSFVLIFAMLAMFLVSFDITVFADSSSEPAAGTAAESDRPTSTAVSGGNVSSTNKGSAVFANSSASEHYYDWKQNDPRWSSITIGSKTMGENGSAVTSLAMLLVKSGFKNESDFNPGTFANDLKSVGAFNGDEFDWNAPTKIVPQFKYCGETTVSCHPGYGWNSLAEYYDDGYYIVVSPVNREYWMAVEKVSTRHMSSTVTCSYASVLDPGTEEHYTYLDSEHYTYLDSEVGTVKVKLYTAPNPSTIVKSGTCGENITYKLYGDGLLELNGSGKMYDVGYNSFSPWYNNKKSIKKVVFKGAISSIGACAFYDCSSLTSITIPDTVTSISEYAFSDCSSLTSITIPDTVTSISEYAFSHCSGLTSVTIPDSVTSIGSNAFYNCSGLTSITIPNSVTSISEYAFSGCSSLTSIDVIQGNMYYSSVDGLLYNYEKNKLIACPGGKKGNITIPDSVTSIGSHAFNHCSSLTSVNIPNSVTSIGSWAFYACNNLTSISIPNSVTSIGDHAFCGCSSLTNITIPKSVTSIGSSAFSSCNKLTNVYYQGSSEDWQKISIGSSNTPLTSANFHYQVQSGKCGDNITYTLYDDGLLELNGSGAMYNFTSNSSPWYSNKNSIKQVAFIGEITTIGKSAFECCSALWDITIPNSVTSIGNYAFYNCSNLRRITISNSVTSIGNCAFYNCHNLTSAYYQGSYEDWQKISISSSNDSLTKTNIYYKMGIIVQSGKCGDNIIYTLDKDGLLEIKGSGAMFNYQITDRGKYCDAPWFHNPHESESPVKKVIFQENITSIGYNAFYLCWNITSITIPNSVTSIGGSEFESCDSLKDIYYSGSESQWNNLNPNNLGLNGNVTVHFEPTVTPLKITVQPENKTVAVGDSVTFNVQAEGEGLTYQWYYKRSGENDWSIWNGKTTATATATVDATCDGMQVYCKVTDQNGNSIDSDAAVITVILYFTASPESSQKIGTPITLKATGGSSYRFYYEQDGKWGNIQNDSSENTCVWTPIVPKNYIIYVDIKDENSIIIATKRIEYTVIDAYSFTLDKANVQNVGVNMTLTAKGGSSYKFYYEYNGAWCNISSNTTGVCDWSPKFAGNYMLYVDIRDASGEVVACRTQAFTLKDPFLFICDSQSTEFPYGKTIHLVAAGGSQYKFYYEKQGEWVRVQDFSAASACAWTPTAAGKYNFYCDIKDASGAVASCKRMTFNITNPYSFTADKPITQSVGTKITFTATGGYQYKFYYEKDGSWVRIQSLSTANTCVWTPTVAGRYNIYCDIADENGTVLAYKGMEFVIGNAEVSEFTFTTSLDSPQPMNTEVTLIATGGASYKFYYEVGGKWATIQNFSTANSATWTPDMIADYTLYVDIKNSSGKVVKTLSKKFSATDPYSFTADVTSPQNIGKSVKFTAAGGASYKFYYQYAGAWVKIQDSTSTTCNWKPNKAGEYMVYVDIKNASGAVLTCRTMKLVFNDPYRFTTSVSSLTQPAGTDISLSANGGASYKFYYEKDGAWVRIQDYSTTKSCTWTPTEAGKYNVFCDIKDASGSVAVCKRITFTITEKCTITASKTNASVGDTITFTATGGSSYKFYYEKDGAWVRIQSFSASNTCNWTPTVEGDYVVYVDVKDASGNLLGCKGVRCVVK